YVDLFAIDFELAHGERPEAVGVAGDDDAVFSEEDEGEGAVKLKESFAEGCSEGALAGVCDEMENDFGVACGLEDGAAGFEEAAELGGVGDVAVVGYRDAAFVAVDREGLGIAFDSVACS